MPSLFTFFNMRPEAALLCTVLSALFAITYASEQRVVCYYTNWSVYRPGNAKFSPQNINPYLCTHLIYAFGGLSRENGLRPYDKYQDIEQGGYAKFTGLKTYNKALKTLLAIGGWNEGSTRFSPLVADIERREEFVKNVVRFLRQNHFDGLDLDWEYPAFRDGGKPRDRDNYAQLVQELREAFDRESSKTGRSRLLLTMAVPAGIEYIDKGYDIPKLNKYLDFMNILSYDYHSAFEPAVNHHSPLYPLEEIDEEYNFDAQLTIDYTIEHYMKSGADRDKLVLGIPTYGRSYTLFNPLATEVGAPADGPGEQGDATREKGYLAYYEICESLESNEWKVEKPNPKAMGPYAFKGNQWVGYDDEDIVRKKAKYVSEKGLGGIMFWAIDNDDFRGKCHGRPYPLIEAGKEALLGTESRSPNDISSTLEKGRSRSTTKPTTTPVISSTTSNGRKRRPKPKTGRPRGSSESSTVTTPVYVYPATTPEPPTTPDPGSDFKCKDEGFFPHPRDCKKYFWCLDSGPSNLGIVAHQFTCPSGLFFNKAADSCDYTRNVICNKKKGGDGSSSTTPRPKVTAATSKTTRLSSATSTTSAPVTTTTRATTTTTIAPELEEEEEEEDYDEADQEDPKAIKELIKLLQEIGGLEGLQRQLAFKEHNSANGDSVVPTAGISRTLYNRVLNRGNTKSPIFKTRQNAQVTSSTSTTPSYKSSIRNRGGPQNQGLEALDEVSNLKKEKPQYVTIHRERPTTPENKLKDDSDEENSDEELDEIEEENENEPKPKNNLRNPEYFVLDRRSKSTSPSTQKETKEITTPRYVTISRGTSSKHQEDSEKETLEKNEDSKFQRDKEEKENESLESNSKSIQITPSYTQINRSKAPLTIDEVEEEKELQTESITLATIKPSKATTTRRPVSPSFTKRLRKRPITTTIRSTPTTVAPTTLETEEFTTRKPTLGRIIRRRKFQRGNSTEEEAPIARGRGRVGFQKSTPQNSKEPELSATEPTVATKKFTFPRRRTTSTSTTTTTTTTTTSAPFIPEDILIEEDDSHKDSLEAPAHIDTQTIDASTVKNLPDLARTAVAALTNLVTVSPLPVVSSSGSPTLRANTPSAFSVYSSTPRFTTGPVLFSSTASTPVAPVARGRQRVKPFAKIVTSPSPAPQVVVARIRAPIPPPIADYEYYDDLSGFLEQSIPSNKVKIHSDGYIECLDQGNFPHPFSCKKFISCAKMENGEVLGWEYTCPKHLSFDPIGGICNWSAGLGCKE